MSGMGIKKSRMDRRNDPILLQITTLNSPLRLGVGGKVTGRNIFFEIFLKTPRKYSVSCCKRVICMQNYFKKIFIFLKNRAVIIVFAKI